MAAPAARRPGELVFTLLLLVFSLWLLWQSFLISGFSGLSTPGVFPMFASAMMVASSVVIFLRTLRRPSPPAEARFVRDVTPLRLVVMLALILAYIVLMSWLGFLIASGLFLLAAFAYLWRASPLWVVLLTLVALATVWVVFRVLFQVVLPKGTVLTGLF